MGKSRGRPSKLTDDTKNKIFEAIKLGATYEIAARSAGIGLSTFHLWKKKGEEKPSSIEGKFLRELELAEAEGEIAMLTKIQLEPGGAKWVLERRYPDRYTKTERREIDAKIDDARDLTDAELTAIAAGED